MKACEPFLPPCTDVESLGPMQPTTAAVSLQMQRSGYQTPSLTVTKSPGQVLGRNDFCKAIQAQGRDEETMLISPVAWI